MVACERRAVTAEEASAAWQRRWDAHMATVNHNPPTPITFATRSCKVPAAIGAVLGAVTAGSVVWTFGQLERR
jgi:hypothetical protein